MCLPLPLPFPPPLTLVSDPVSDSMSAPVSDSVSAPVFLHLRFACAPSGVASAAGRDGHNQELSKYKVSSVGKHSE